MKIDMTSTATLMEHKICCFSIKKYHTNFVLKLYKISHIDDEEWLYGLLHEST